MTLRDSGAVYKCTDDDDDYYYYYRPSFDDVTRINFRFQLLVTWSLVTSAWPWTMVHLHMKFGADIFIQSGVIDIFRILKMVAAATLDLFG